MGKRIFIVNKNFGTDGKTTARILAVLAGALADMGNDLFVVCVTTDQNRLKKYVDEYVSKINLKAINGSIFSKRGFIYKILSSILFFFYLVFQLVKQRPKKIYVATNPPVLIPFVCALYSRAFNSEMFYHVQDIHPELTRLVFGKKMILFRLFQLMDRFSLIQSRKIFTINSSMAETLLTRAARSLPIELIENPFLGQVLPLDLYPKREGIVFSGNMGRFQNIESLCSALALYYKNSGAQAVTFIGDGCYFGYIKKFIFDNKLSSKIFLHDSIPPEEMGSFLSSYKWGVVSIREEVDKYAFPSKTATYLAAGVPLLSISSPGSALEIWTNKNGFGITSSCAIESILSTLKKTDSVSEDEYRGYMLKAHQYSLDYLKPEFHVDKLVKGISGAGNHRI